MIDIEVKNNPDDEWDKRVLLSNYGSYFQTVSNANHLKKFNEYNPRFIYFKKNDLIIGQHLIFLRHRGTTFFKKLFGKILQPFYFWNKSILVFDDSYKEEILDCFHKFLENKKFIGMETPLVNYDLKLPNTKIGTVILEIKKTFEETISERDPHSTQKHIALSANMCDPTKKGLIARKCENIDDIQIYYNMLKKHRTHLGLETESFDATCQRILTLQKENAGGALVAFHNKNPVSGIIFVIFNGWIHNIGVANTQYSLENKLSSLDYLRCMLIGMGVRQKCKFFDFGGISLNPKNEKEKGIIHSQTKWGGKITEYFKYSNI